MDVVFHRRFRINSYEVDPYGEVRPSSIMAYFQEAGGQQSERWKLSVLDMFKQGKTWVMTRYHLKFLHRPRIGEEVDVATWSSGRDGRFAIREFEMKSTDGQIVALGTASCMLIDLKERKPVDVGDLLPNVAIDPRRAIDDKFASLPKVERIDREVEIPVMLRDLDLNGHVNHIVYVQWGLEAVPIDIWQSYRPSSVEIGYRAETHYGAKVKVVVTIDREPAGGGGPQVIHQVLHAETGAELARLRSNWTKLNASK